MTSHSPIGKEGAGWSAERRCRKAPMFWRATTWLVIVTQLASPFAGVLRASNMPQTVPQDAPQAAAIPVRIQPESPPSAVPRFSTDPTDADFLHVHLFASALVPIGAPTSPTENRDLADAIVRYSQRARSDDVSALTLYLDNHPASAWRPALLLNIGKIYRSTGYISRALSAWEGVWQLTKASDDYEARAIANDAAGELAELYAKLGRYPALEALFTHV
jgi:hypothetical protein